MAGNVFNAGVPSTTTTSSSSGSIGGYLSKAIKNAIAADVTRANENSINPLHKYDTVTYHLKLYVGEFVNILFFDNDEVSSDPVAIIAETGVTDISIDDLSFTNYFGLAGGLYTSTATVFEFKLKEPLGTTLFDRLFTAAEMIGANNFTKMPFYLEISYVGREKETGKPIKIEEGKRTYPILINKVEATVDRGGTVYTCKATRVNDFALSDVGSTTQEIHNLVGDNAKAITDKLTDKLNSPERLQKLRAQFGPEDTPISSYKVSYVGFDNPTEDLKFIDSGNTQVSKSSRNDNFLTLDIENTTAVVGKGQPLNRVIDQLMLSTVWFQKNTKNEDETEPTDGQKNQTKTSYKRIYQIESRVKITGYNEELEDYVREMEYTVRPVSMGIATALPTSPKETKESNMVELDTNITLPWKHGKNGAITRKYSYLYTGMNTSVIDFDFTVNLGWYVPLVTSHITHANASQPDSGGQYAKANDPTAQPYRLNQQEEANKSTNTSVKKIDKKTDTNSYMSREELSKLKKFPITYRNGNYQKDFNQGVGDVRTDAKDWASSALREYAQNARQEFVYIDMKIVGDPYWITIKSNEILYFMFIMGFPDEPGEDGFIPKPSNSIMSGVFQITQCENNFSNGKFTQKIYGVRDNMVRLSGKYDAEGGSESTQSTNGTDSEQASGDYAGSSSNNTGNAGST